MSQSDREAILEMLQNGEVLTRKKIDQQIGTLKGPSRISELRQEGHDIQHKTIKTKNDRRVNAYYIPDAIEGNLCYCPHCEKLSRAVSDVYKVCFDCNEELEVVVNDGNEVEAA